MTPNEFERRLKELQEEFKDLFDKYAPRIAGTVAVRFFKSRFQIEGWERSGDWKEVQRRMSSWTRNGKTVKNYYKGAKLTRKILTGDTGDLGRSIEVEKESPGSVTIWTRPIGSNKAYARVHNEGLRAGRGSGFTMPKRQFMGEHPELNKLIIEELERKLKEIAK